MFDKNIIQVYKSKGSKTRLVILCPRLKVNLMKYCVIHRKYEDIYQLDLCSLSGINSIKYFYTPCRTFSIGA